MERFDWEGLLRVMTYGLTTTRDATSMVDSAFKGAIDRPTHGTPEEYLEAIQTALGTDLDLAEVIGLDLHTDASVREYLRVVEERLLRQLAG